MLDTSATNVDGPGAQGSAPSGTAAAPAMQPLLTFIHRMVATGTERGPVPGGLFWPSGASGISYQFPRPFKSWLYASPSTVPRPGTLQLRRAVMEIEEFHRLRCIVAQTR